MSDLHCAFCGKKEHEVGKLVAGGGKQPRADLPRTQICDECIRLCYAIIEGGVQPKSARTEWTRFRNANEEYEWTTVRQKEGVLLLVRRAGTDPPVGGMYPLDAKLNSDDARELLRLVGHRLT